MANILTLSNADRDVLVAAVRRFAVECSGFAARDVASPHPGTNGSAAFWQARHNVAVDLYTRIVMGK